MQGTEIDALNPAAIDTDVPLMSATSGKLAQRQVLGLHEEKRPQGCHMRRLNTVSSCKRQTNRDNDLYKSLFDNKNFIRIYVSYTK